MESTLFVGVLRIGGHFAAVHSTPKYRAFVSKHPETDIRVAIATARAFAEQQKIPFKERLLYLDRPLVTLWMQESGWHPALIKSDDVTVIPGYCGSDDPEDAYQVALKVASILKTDCVPKIGVTACLNRS
ncbi:MAG: hypothetical protein K1X28_04945 [Parachlamydiales bacterium]|nr:hypothetical protein [Parachlamydiales bacterium]